MSIYKSPKGAHASLNEVEKVSQRKVNSDLDENKQKNELTCY